MVDLRSQCRCRRPRRIDGCGAPGISSAVHDEPCAREVRRQPGGSGRLWADLREDAAECQHDGQEAEAFFLFIKTFCFFVNHFLNLFEHMFQFNLFLFSFSRRTERIGDRPCPFPAFRDEAAGGSFDFKEEEDATPVSAFFDFASYEANQL